MNIHTAQKIIQLLWTISTITRARASKAEMLQVCGPKVYQDSSHYTLNY